MAGNIMTRLVRAECANFSSVNDQCSGLTVLNELFREPGECWIFNNKPCQYFRDCILPLAKYEGNYEKMLNAYSKLDKAATVNTKIRHCECGEEIAPRQRCCQKCARKRRLSSYRRINENRVTDTTINQKPEF